jgi:hypothetical protein
VGDPKWERVVDPVRVAEAEHKQSRTTDWIDSARGLSAAGNAHIGATALAGPTSLSDA